MKTQAKDEDLTKVIVKEGDVLGIPAEQGRYTPVLVVQTRAKASFLEAAGFDYRFVREDGEVEGNGHVRSIGCELPPEWIRYDFAEVTQHVQLPGSAAESAAFVNNSEIGKGAFSEPERHPSYGSVSVARVSGSAQLFQSPFEHQHYISVQVSRAERQRNLSTDHHFTRAELIEFSMSEAQWARFVSSIGSGGGVPCTLERVGGHRQERCPQQPGIERFHDDLRKSAEKAVEFMKLAIAKGNEVLEAKAPTKTQRAELVEAMDRAHRTLTDSLPWIAEMLRERMSEIVVDGKTELEAFALNTLIRYGLDGISKNPLSLPDPKEKK